MLQIAHLDTAIVDQPPGGLHPGLEIRHAGDRLERILRRHQPPQGVEAEAVERPMADMEMAPVGRVERAPEEADAAAVPISAIHMGSDQGRTCPVPRTRYL